MEECPRRPTQVVLTVNADMGSPHDVRPAPSKRANQTSGLRIVQQDQIASADPITYALGVGGHHVDEMAEFRRPEGAPVARFAVNPVVQALRDSEELSVAIDDQPSDVDGEVFRVSDQNLEHVGDSAAGGGRAEVPNHPATGHLAEIRCGGQQSGSPWQSYDLLKRGNWPARHLDTVDLVHKTSLTASPVLAREHRRLRGAR